MKNSKIKKTSQFFRVVSILILILGIICGPVFGALFPVVSSGFYSLHEEFNTALMLKIWVTALFAFLIFWAIYAHLRNQETMLEILTGQNPNSAETPAPATEEQAEPKPESPTAPKAE